MPNFLRKACRAGFSGEPGGAPEIRGTTPAKGNFGRTNVDNAMLLNYGCCNWVGSVLLVPGVMLKVNALDFNPK